MCRLLNRCSLLHELRGLQSCVTRPKAAYSTLLGVKRPSISGGLLATGGGCRRMKATGRESRTRECARACVHLCICAYARWTRAALMSADMTDGVRTAHTHTRACTHAHTCVHAAVRWRVCTGMLACRHTRRHAAPVPAALGASMQTPASPHQRPPLLPTLPNYLPIHPSMHPC
jgi:hypothetical protein